MLGVVLGIAGGLGGGVERDARFPLGLFRTGGPLQAVFERANDGEIFVQPLAVGAAEFLAQLLGIGQHAVQQQRFFLGAITLAVSGAEETFEGQLGIQLASERGCGTGPGDVRAVDAGVADILVDAGGDRGDAQFHGGDGRLAAGFLHGQLVHRDAVATDIDAERFRDRGAGQPAGDFDIVPVATNAARVPQICQDQ